MDNFPPNFFYKVSKMQLGVIIICNSMISDKELKFAESKPNQSTLEMVAKNKHLIILSLNNKVLKMYLCLIIKRKLRDDFYQHV